MGFNESIIYPIDSQLLLELGATLSPQTFARLIDDYVLIYEVLMRAMIGASEKLERKCDAELTGIEAELRDFLFSEDDDLRLHVWVPTARFVFTSPKTLPQLRLCEIALTTLH